MPMNPRLLRPLASQSLADADAAAYIAAVEQADTQALEPAVRNAITAFVIGCKRDGIWSAIKASCILMGARTLSGALVPLVGSAPTNVNNNFVSGDYNRKTGLVGNGTSKSLDTGRANNAEPQDNNHNAVYASTLGTLVFFGGGGTAPGANTIGAMGSRQRNSSVDSYGSTLAPPTLVGISRIASGSYTQRFNGASRSVSRTSEAPSSGNLFFMYEGLLAYGSHRAAFYSIGEYLDLALLDTRVTALYNAIGAAIP